MALARPIAFKRAKKLTGRYINATVRRVFMQHHADLLDAAFWQGHKEEILAGYVHDVFPYEAHRRFEHQRRSDALATSET